MAKQGQEELTVSFSEQLLDPNLSFPDYQQTTRQLTLNRARCVDPTLIDTFLRNLRHGSDDVIKQKLNNYSKQTEHRNDTRLQKCDSLIHREIYPNWQVRDSIIDFCAAQATQLKHELDQQKSSEVIRTTVDTRLDPYSVRDLQHEEEKKYKQWNDLNNWVENNRTIEGILRGSSDHFLKQNCDQNVDYLRKFWDLSSK
ncbi:Mitochondrial intermembrane space cysteine motif-containing protein MIX23 [Nakaseomyces glabratus]|uniref:Mitochondrial intermembrane space cysteine motif-containing protein MIX23 n=1 Tax=Candida glabrata TaxID=5478 RepID=A0A0W0EQ01_CANGB|nr:Caffeine-induced death protein 2 [Nakaseomyces glabratus]KAH7579689.1 Caffeine-induced death protein 2 [Nakaseomyces glabratus]KAH7580314.1 Caffeine-induced death protein 2 [Nakaseomyces glabratus]KAH7592869.1 Caffeine-induced death protein 2 [Nakaseomyces glabratus]KAH7610714.1 Caffeine-induced death protein 2 [Nakaseomyces glabratus]